MIILMSVESKRSSIGSEVRKFTSTADALQYMKRKNIKRRWVTILENGICKQYILSTLTMGYEY